MATKKATKTVALADLPKLGELLEGAEFRGLTTKPDGTHCAVFVLAFAEKEASQPKQIEWAKKLGGELATRAVMNLLIATMTLPAGWYHTADLYGSSLAWGCGSYGYQLCTLRSAEGGAVAVRLIPLSV